MIEIIPAIDILGGECVRLTKGDYSRRTTYSPSPVDVALRFKDMGIRKVHIVDLDGAKASCPKNLSTVEKIKGATGLEIEFGGGVKSTDSLLSALGCGIDQVIVGSLAISSPDLIRSWTEGIVSPDRLVLGADLRDGKVATRGWLDCSETGVEELIGMYPEIGRVICTQISKDGTLGGVDVQFYSSLQGLFPEKEITVSGGIGSMDDILSLDKAGLHSVIVGKAYYEGKITETQIRDYCKER